MTHCIRRDELETIQYLLLLQWCKIVSGLYLLLLYPKTFRHGIDPPPSMSNRATIMLFCCTYTRLLGLLIFLESGLSNSTVEFGPKCEWKPIWTHFSFFSTGNFGSRLRRLETHPQHLLLRTFPNKYKVEYIYPFFFKCDQKSRQAFLWG